MGRVTRDEWGNWVDFSPHVVRTTDDVGGRRILRCTDCGETFLSEYSYQGEWKGTSRYYEYRRCQDCRASEEEDRATDVVEYLRTHEEYDAHL